MNTVNDQEPMNKLIVCVCFYFQVLSLYLFHLQWWTRVPQPTTSQMVIKYQDLLIFEIHKKRNLGVNKIAT